MDPRVAVVVVPLVVVVDAVVEVCICFDPCDQQVCRFVLGYVCLMCRSRYSLRAAVASIEKIVADLSALLQAVLDLVAVVVVVVAALLVAAVVPLAVPVVPVALPGGEPGEPGEALRSSL